MSLLEHLLSGHLKTAFLPSRHGRRRLRCPPFPLAFYAAAAAAAAVAAVAVNNFFSPLFDMADGFFDGGLDLTHALQQLQ